MFYFQLIAFSFCLLSCVYESVTSFKAYRNPLRSDKAKGKKKLKNEEVSEIKRSEALTLFANILFGIGSIWLLIDLFK